MELINSNIHMDTEKCKTVFQLTLEDDVNLKEDCQDISRIILQDGMVQIAECKATADHVTVKGTLLVDVLFLTDDEEEVLANTCGKLNFEEVVYAEGIRPGDTIDLFWKIEDLSVGMINSRKISVRSLVTFMLQADCLYDEIAATDLCLDDNEKVEYRKKDIQIAKLNICKRDICRIHQDMTLPNGYPNIYRIIYQCSRLVNLSFKPKNNVISVDGEQEVFLLYDSADEEENIRYYEQCMPFHAEVECQGCQEHMTLDMKWSILSKEFDVKPDFDGEERVVSIDTILQLCIKLYEEDQISVLSDVYGIQNEIVTSGKQGKFNRLLMHNEGYAKIEETVSMESNPNIMQMLFVKGDVSMEDSAIEEDGVRVDGIIDVKCLYITEDDKYPYMAKEESIPFSYLLSAKNLPKDCICNLELSLDQITATVTDANGLLVKATVKVKGLFFEEFEQELLTELNVKPLDKKMMQSQPQIVIYYVQPGDSLYQIGKKYYMPIQSIMDLNGLEGDELKVGQQLMIMR